VRSGAGDIAAAAFGPKALQGVRRAMVEKGWNRNTVNSSVRIVVRMFKQAVADELYTAEQITALRCVKPLRAGELATPKSERVKSVPEASVTATVPHLGSTLAAMARLRELTGMRPGELCAMRGTDYRPRKKGAD